MNLIRPLFPKSLSKAEHRLLLHQPEFWSTRLHLVAWYGILFIAALAGLAFIAPLDPRLRTDAPYWLMFMIIISIIALTVWLIYLLRFNVFKRYGQISPVKTLFTFIAYFLCAGIILLFNYVQPVVETLRTNAKYGYQEVTDDVNGVNVRISQLYFDSLDNDWREDSVKLVTSPELNRNHYPATEVTMPDTVTLTPHHPIILLDSAEYRARIGSADSVIRVNDSMSVVYTCPVYVFLEDYLYSARHRKLLSSVDIYRQYLQHYKAPSDRAMMERELQAILYKYNVGVDTLMYYGDTENESRTIRSVIQRRYYLETAQRSLMNIQEKKYRWMNSELPLYIRLFYYFTLFAAVLVFVFRHSTIKTFFLSLLSIVILSILNALFLSFSSATETTFLGLIIFYAVLFFVLTLLIWRSSTRNVVSGISLNLLTLLLPILPLCVLEWYFERQRAHYYSIGDYSAIDEKPSYFITSEVGGYLLLLIFIVSYLHFAYRKWYSQPEE